jgi:alkylated DNA nucleotide flippase Atl1
MLAAMGMDAFAPRAARELLASGETARKRSVESLDQLTAREAQIARLARDGLSNPEIGARLWRCSRSSDSVLKSLTAAGVLEPVDRAKPTRWRMAIKHRRNRILRMSQLIPDGRCTTYGDFAIAVYDNVRLAITVGRVAAHNPAFANPHRVVGAGSIIKDDWLDDQGRGPEECERRLIDDGIAVDDHRTDPEKFIGRPSSSSCWTLTRRLPVSTKPLDC